MSLSDRGHLLLNGSLVHVTERIAGAIADYGWLFFV